MLSSSWSESELKCVQPFLWLTSASPSGGAVVSLSLGSDHNPGSHGAGFVRAKGKKNKMKIFKNGIYWIKKKINPSLTSHTGSGTVFVI